MTIPGEQMLSFNKYLDAKTLFEEICAYFGGNETTKKTQKTLLKQQFENFTAFSNESLDKLFSRLHKLVSQLAVLGVEIEKEDLNMKFLRSLPDEFHTHVIVWMNKPDIETMKLNDLYNNFKIVEQSLRKSGIYGTSSGNVALLSSPSIGKAEEVEEVEGVSNATNGGPSTSSQKTVAGLGDPAFYVFMSSQSSGSPLNHEDLEQVDGDDLEEMDIKWQVALLSMRAKKHWQRTGKQITINGNDTARFDKKKVECFNCYRLGHFAKECKSPRKQENRNTWYKQDRKKEVTIEEPKAMLAIDGIGYDWSSMAIEEDAPPNAALLAN